MSTKWVSTDFLPPERAEYSKFFLNMAVEDFDMEESSPPNQKARDQKNNGWRYPFQKTVSGL